VAFGTRELKLDAGLKIAMANVICHKINIDLSIHAILRGAEGKVTQSCHTFPNHENQRSE
jgi:hypothetical protein